MTLPVDMHFVVFGLLSALAGISMLVRTALRKGSALAWLAASMVCVAVESVLLPHAGSGHAALAAVALLLPGAYFCAAQAIRLSIGAAPVGRPVLAMATGLAALSQGLLFLDLAPVLQYLPFQLSGLVLLADAVLAMARQRDRDLVSNCLLVLCACSVAGIVLRIPLFPLLLGQQVAWLPMGRALFEHVFIHGLSALSTGLALLVITRIVTNEIAGYRHQSERDDLTGLLNRRVFDKVVDTPAPMRGAVVMCDIDHFKAINDGFGHHIGDDVIRSFACILSHHGDYVGRIGGEEFALLLFDATLEDAAREANAIRTFFHQYRHPAMGEARAISASFGIAAFEAGKPVRGAMREADKALYEAKREGRNLVREAAPRIPRAPAPRGVAQAA